LSVPVTSVEGYAHRLDAALGEVVGGVIATYLHGSSALGGFVPGRSDIDVLVVCDDRPTSRGELNVAVQTLQSPAGECPGRGLELSMVARRHARGPGPPWPFVLHVSTCPDSHKVVFGDQRPGDPDLLMHYAVCRAAGIAVRGPAPVEMIGHVARADVLGYIRAELLWALEHAPEAYGVLNACRALAYLDRHEIVSKVDGAQYALERGAPHGLIATALAMQQGDRPDSPPSEAARHFMIAVGTALAARPR
jgi:Aminoglycoside adenylyltransferase, C-terminal domain/Nucleotidyltransferase domain